MSETVHFVHLSDPHITDPHTPDNHLHSDTTATFRRVQQSIAALEPRPDFVVISGDLTNRGTRENFVALRDLLEGFTVPVILALGNHDTHATFYDVVLGQPEHGDTPYFHAQVIRGLHIITLDSSVEGAVIGTLEPEQRLWLEAELEAHPELPKLIVVHHPPGDLHMPIFDDINWLADDRSALGAMLSAAQGRGRRIAAVLSGHVHFDAFSIWHGVPCLISAGLHNLTDPLMTDGLRATRGGAFSVCRVKGGELTSYNVQLPSDGQQLYHVSMEQMRRMTAEFEASKAEGTAAETSHA